MSIHVLPVLMNLAYSITENPEPSTVYISFIIVPYGRLNHLRTEFCDILLAF